MLGMIHTQKESLSHYKVLLHNLFHVCTATKSSTGMSLRGASLRPKLEKARRKGSKSMYNTHVYGESKSGSYRNIIIIISTFVSFIYLKYLLK